MQAKGACVLPYMGNEVSMTIILPNIGFKLSDVENQFKIIKIQNILDHLIRTQTNEPKSEDVNLHLPRFKCEYKQEVIKNNLLKF